MGEDIIPPFIAFYYSAFFKDVEAESNFTIGAYMRLLRAYHDRECLGLPNDESKLQRFSGCGDSAEWNHVRGSIFGFGKESERKDWHQTGFFRLGKDGMWQQKRAKEEYARAKLKLEKFRDEQRRKANMRWSKVSRDKLKTDSQATAPAMPRHMPRHYLSRE